MGDKKILYKRCSIDASRSWIEVVLSHQNTEKTIKIKVDHPENDDFVLRLIDQANVNYSACIHRCKRSEEVTAYGCLTSKVLGLNDIPITFINPKYVKNVFLKFLQLFFKDDIGYAEFCVRDEKSMDIPSSPSKVSSLITDIVSYCNSSDTEDNDGSDDDIDDGLVDIRQFLMTVLSYIARVQSNKVHKNMQKGKIKKRANICGGVSNLHNILRNSLHDNMTDTLSHTGENVHRLICEYKNVLYMENMKIREKIDYVKQLLDHNPERVCLYENLNISFRFMMETIQSIFDGLFTRILPQTSMLNCLYGTLYQASVLNEMNILKHYAKAIHIPLMFRLVYSCFKDRNNPPPSHDSSSDVATLTRYVRRMREHNNNNNYEENLQTLCELAVRIDIKDSPTLNHLYWVLNQERGCTYEYYLIIIINIYVLGKCGEMKKDNKVSNARKFADPLYKILRLFHRYVVDDLKCLNVALCSETFENFSRAYSIDIKECLRKFVKDLHVSVT